MTAVARVFLTKGSGNVVVNKKMMVDYFQRITLRDEIYRPMQVVEMEISLLTHTAPVERVKVTDMS